jgi:hypothetical protein
VKASTPHERAAITDWTAVKPDAFPAAFISRGTSGGLCPAQKPVLHNGWPATTA